MAKLEAIHSIESRPMHYRHLGKSNLKISALCLGTMMFGDQTALADAGSIVAEAHVNGVNYIDTADNYSKGGSETMAGQLLKGQRLAQTEFREESLLIAQQLKVHAENRGISLAQFATAWVLAKAPAP